MDEAPDEKAAPEPAFETWRYDGLAYHPYPSQGSSPSEALMPASTTVDETANRVDKTIRDAEKNLNELTERAQRTIEEGLETLRGQARAYADTAGESLDVAQKYLTDRVQERPLAATFAALGVGLLIGLLLAGGRDR